MGPGSMWEMAKIGVSLWRPEQSHTGCPGLKARVPVCVTEALTELRVLEAQQRLLAPSSGPGRLLPSSGTDFREGLCV